MFETTYRKSLIMSGKAIAIVGARGMGKSTETKRYLSIVPEKARLVYDPEGEHQDLFPYPFIPFQQFKQKAALVEDAFIVWEEATIIIPNTSHDEAVKEMLVRARHRNNTMLFVFHSFRYLPRYVFDLLDYIVIFKTADSEKFIQQRYDSDRFTEAFMRVKNAEFLYNEKTNRYYSPHEEFSIHEIPMPKQK